MNLKVSRRAVDCVQLSGAVDGTHISGVGCASLLTAVDCVHMLTGDAILCGFGLVAMKSELLLFVSVQPSALRMIALVLLAAGAGALPLKQEAVAP